MTAKKPAHGVRFVREGGEATDEFGAHSQLADALAQALIDNPPLQVMGLLGGWATRPRSSAAPTVLRRPASSWFWWAGITSCRRRRARPKTPRNPLSQARRRRPQGRHREDPRSVLNLTPCAQGGGAKTDLASADCHSNRYSPMPSYWS
jgi:hypothetical protein